MIKAIEEEEMKRTTNYQQNQHFKQQQYHSVRNMSPSPSPRPKLFSVNQNKTVPSKVFQYVDRKYSDSDSRHGSFSDETLLNPDSANKGILRVWLRNFENKRKRENSFIWVLSRTNIFKFK